MRRQIADEGALPVIPSRSNVTRYDKLAGNYLGAAAIAGAIVWVKL